MLSLRNQVLRQEGVNSVLPGGNCVRPLSEGGLVPLNIDGYNGTH